METVAGAGADPARGGSAGFGRGLAWHGCWMGRLAAAVRIAANREHCLGFLFTSADDRGAGYCCAGRTDRGSAPRVARRAAFAGGSAAARLTQNHTNCGGFLDLNRSAANTALEGRA